MSFSTVTSKYRKSEIKTGVHLVEISDLFYLRNAAKEIIKINGFPAIIVQFRNKGGIHEQMYLADKGVRQKYFYDVLRNAKVPFEAGQSPKKENCIHKKLYIAIQEIHHVCDENIVKENGEPIIEYRIFKTIPVNGDIVPKLKGDPLFNNGIAQDDFKTYKNTSTSFIEIEKEEEPPTFFIE